MMHSTISVAGMGMGPSIHPELQEASPWLREAVSVSESMMDSGIDPGFALAVAAAVPVILRILKMGNEYTKAWVSDWQEGNQIKRATERAKMEIELDKLRQIEAQNHPNGSPPL